MLSHGNVSMIRGTVVFKRISDFNGPYMNKNRINKKISSPSGQRYNRQFCI